MTELNVDGMALAPGVVETIVSIAANEVEGVACIGPSTTSGLRSVFGSKPSTQGIDITVDEEDKLHISIRVDVYYGYVLPDPSGYLRRGDQPGWHSGRLCGRVHRRHAVRPLSVRRL